MIRLRLISPHRPYETALTLSQGPTSLLLLDDVSSRKELHSTLENRKNISIVDISRYASETAADFSRRYAHFIARLSEKNDSPDWWALSLVGRNPLSSQLPRRCFQMGLIAKQLEDKSTTVVAITQDAILARHALRWAHASGISAEADVPLSTGLIGHLLIWLPLGPLYACMRAFLRTLWVRASTPLRTSPKEEYDLIATLLNHQSFDADGRYHDTYFGDLPYRLAQSGRTPLVFGAITHDFIRTLRRSSHAGIPIVPMEIRMGPGALIRLLLKTLRYRIAGFPLQGETQFEGRDVRDMILAEINEHARQTRLFSDLHFREALRALLPHIHTSRLLFPFENRAWERMLLQALSEHAPHTPSIGYQHATITPFHLNFILGQDEAKRLPLPTKIVTMGSVTLKHLRENGFPPERLAEGAALRQAPIVRSSSSYDPTAPLLVALASSIEEYVRVLNFLNSTCTKNTPPIILRPHPVIPLKEALRRTGPLDFTYTIDSGRTLDDAIQSAGILIFASGTLGLEAIRRGIPAIFLDIGTFLSTDPLTDFSRLKWSVRTPQELETAIDAISALSHEDFAARCRAAKQYAESYCRKADQDTLTPLIAPFPHDVN